MVKYEPVTPLGQPKATKSLGGLVEPEPLPRLLIWHICHESFGDLADLNHSYTLLGAWSCPTMVTPSDRLNKPLFANGFIIAFASIFSLIIVSFIFVAFLN